MGRGVTGESVASGTQEPLLTVSHTGYHLPQCSPLGFFLRLEIPQREASEYSGQEVRENSETRSHYCLPQGEGMKEGGRGVVKALYASSVLPGPGGRWISTWLVGQANTEDPCSLTISPNKHLPTNQHQHHYHMPSVEPLQEFSPFVKALDPEARVLRTYVEFRSLSQG